MASEIIIKTGLALFIIGWSILGFWLCINYNRLFGPHKDDPAESPGARSFGVAHIVAVWIGGIVLATYFISR